MNSPNMRYGFVLPGGTAPEQLELAVLAEQAGWDGIFVWEAAFGVDAWGLLSAMAVRTTRIRLGTMLTPLPWRRPWKVASQVATLDQLSAGRAILAVGVGATDTELPSTGENNDLHDRAERMDEGIDLIRGLWEGRTSYHGKHYDYETGRMDLTTMTEPVQRRIPIWVVGVWPRPKSMHRVLRCDGLIPQYSGAGTPADAAAARAWLASRGAAPDLDVIADGETPAGDHAAAVATVAPWAGAGCTWWLETRWELPHESPDRLHQVRERLSAGPPAVPVVPVK
jgi:alkanesulfonate monooxygenase SsuD/methylene tetrahydromethanopterin reductase-like flavin-dependent oxidoreductase (luciferase family)